MECSNGGFGFGVWGLEFEMEKRSDIIMSIREVLALEVEWWSTRTTTVTWPPSIVEGLKAVSQGPIESCVNSGDVLFVAISDFRNSLSLSDSLSCWAAQGYSLFFDDLMSRDQSINWFNLVVPALANLLLRLPSLLQSHYLNSHPTTLLRLLPSQHPGIVLLSQELIAALIACSFFCLFPATNRGAKHLPLINFDHMFASLYDSYSEKQENKIRCLVHYFERICWTMPVGFVSFERKVLPLQCSPLDIAYPKADFWSQSSISLCHFEVQRTGFIEDHTHEALEVDFANKYIGGGALNKGCVQEEIRFMINPELIVGMLFLPSMSDNEAIEIVGTERFSNYTGYASTFRFAGDHVDMKDVDVLGRRKTRITAIDALCSPGLRQYGLECLLREINKAFCGFLDQNKYKLSKRQSQDDMVEGAQPGQDARSLNKHGVPSTSVQTDYGASGDHEVGIGIVTGNWGCGAFGGDPELKTIIQWLAASQALRPFISYHTFGVEALKNLEQVIEWIVEQHWSVGELWDMLTEYSAQRIQGQTNLGFFTWLLPSLPHHHDPMLLDE